MRGQSPVGVEKLGLAILPTALRDAGLGVRIPRSPSNCSATTTTSHTRRDTRGHTRHSRTRGHTRHSRRDTKTSHTRGHTRQSRPDTRGHTRRSHTRRGHTPRARGGAEELG